MTAPARHPVAAPKKRKPKLTDSKKPSKTALASRHGRAHHIGRAIGGYAGGPVGAAIGGAAGDLFSELTGQGSYTLHRNSIMRGSAQAPRFESSHDFIELSHSEFVTDIKSSIAFNRHVFSINPGDSGTFPWLSTIASSYELYEFLGLVWAYKPTSGDAVASDNPALGAIVMATNYNVEDPPFIDKRQMESYEFSTSCAPCAEMLHPVECKSNLNVLNRLYVSADRPGADYLATDTTDDRFKFLGRTELATIGNIEDGDVLGELWVTYKVRLYKPKLALPTQVYNHWLGYIPDPYTILGETHLAYSGNSDTVTLTSGGTLGTVSAHSLLMFEHTGDYLLVYSFGNPPGSGSSSGVPVRGVVTGGYASASAGFWATTSDAWINCTSTNARTTFMWGFRILEPNTILQLTCPSFVGTADTVDVTVASLPLGSTGNLSEMKQIMAVYPPGKRDFFSPTDSGLSADRAYKDATVLAYKQNLARQRKRKHKHPGIETPASTTDSKDNYVVVSQV